MKIKFFKKLIFMGVITLVFIFIRANLKQDLNKPNIILITVDALRSDHLSCYGYSRGTSHNIDELAQEGVMFTQAVSTASWTPPSICSILTGKYPYAFGLFEVSKDWGSISADSIASLPKILKDNGYKTCLISSHYGLNKLNGLKRNFDKFNCWITGRDENISSAVIEWLKENRNKPFFIWVHYMGPHAPYLPPFPYDTLYLEEDSYTNKHLSTENSPVSAAFERVAEIEYQFSQYDGEIANTDEQLGILLKNIYKLNLSKKTLIILTADHGESLDEHNCYFNHGCNLYDSILRVPLIMVYRGLIPAGKIIESQVSLIDIMPTILEVLKIKISSPIDGISILPLILDIRKKNNNRYTFSERFFQKERQVAVRTTAWKLIYNLHSNKYELYDLRADPKENNNVILIEQEKSRELKNKLDDYLREIPAFAVRKNKSMDEETKIMLESLGYLQ
ncbi:sulfatase [Candidatus Omnitrophota bacterium]